MDVTNAVAAIGGETANVVAVGGAILAVLAVVVGFRAVRKIFG